MVPTPYTFLGLPEFRNRRREIEAMEDWWAGDDPNALLIHGRRRVGKSWLLRRFAHGKPTVILVGERLPAGMQLARFSRELGAHLGGVAPVISDVPDLFRVLLRLAAEDRWLVVIDEFPYLLPSSEQEREAMLTAIQAALEDRDGSRLKLVLCGSHLSVMEGMLAARSGLHGRLRPLRVRPMSLGESEGFIDEADPLARLQRYAITGGMPRILSLLGSRGSLRDRVCANVLNPNGPLFDDPRDVLEQELRHTDNYFAILEVLSGRRQMASGDITAASRRSGGGIWTLLDTLRDMHLVEKVSSYGADPGAHGQYRLLDPFLRFWFRYVFPFQESLASGLAPEDLWDEHIAPTLPEHTSWVFEDECRRWVRTVHGRHAPTVASWSGSAGPRRVDPDRGSEEIDIVGGIRRRVQLLGECKWTNSPVEFGVLRDLDDHKVPALRHNKFTIARDLRVLLISRSGFSPSLTAEASKRSGLELIEASRVIRDLIAAG